MGVLSGRTAVERTTGAVERHADPCEPVGQHIVGERNDLLAAGMHIAMHVADEMADPRSLGEVPRIHHEHVFVRRSNDVGRFCVVMEKLPRMEHRAGRKFEGEDDTIGRFNEPSNSTAIDGTHWKFDNGQTGRRLGMWMEHAYRDWG